MIDLHEMTRIPRMTRDECLALVRMLQGHVAADVTHAFEELARLSQSYVAYAVLERIKRHWVLVSRADDLVSAANAAVAEALSFLAERNEPGNNPLAFIKKRIGWAIKSVSGSELISIDGDTVARASKRGNLARLPTVATGRQLERICVPNDDLRQCEFLEWILAKCSAKEQQVIQKKLYGHSVAKIANDMACTQPVVIRILTDVESRCIAALRSNFSE